MKKTEKASFVRVLVDLIKADSVIDEGEMALYAKLKEDFGITKEDEVNADSMTLADAISVLACLPERNKELLMQVFSDMTVSDGFCAKEEAQLMLALIYCLKGESCNMCDVYSIHEPNVCIEDNQVIYVESIFDKEINEDIQINYRAIDKELRISGFSFVYLPHIIEHYRTTEPELFKQISCFLAPNIPAAEVSTLISQLLSITTARYCNEQLCNKLGMSHLRDVPPSLLIKINNTYVGELLYTNFLRITIDDDILKLIQELTDTYCRMLSSDKRIITNNEEAFGQFLYHGFYKQLFDIYIIKKGVRSKILIDIPNGIIMLPELGSEIKGLHRRDKALYLLMLIESGFGGIDFSLPKTGADKKKYDERARRVQNNYKRIYSLFNGNRDDAPQLFDPEIRRPIISNIRRCISRLNNGLHNCQDYNIDKNSFGRYLININPEMVFVRMDDIESELLNSSIFSELQMERYRLQDCN